MPISILICAYFCSVYYFWMELRTFFFFETFILLIIFLKIHPRSSIFSSNKTARREKGDKSILCKQCLSIDFKGKYADIMVVKKLMKLFLEEAVWRWDKERLSIRIQRPLPLRGGLAPTPFLLWLHLYCSGCSESKTTDYSLCLSSRKFGVTVTSLDHVSVVLSKQSQISWLQQSWYSWLAESARSTRATTAGLHRTSL